MGETAARPNVLFIMADQFRHDYLGCAGGDFVRTPNIDRIAAAGVRFTRCCTNSPLCAPARIALATGMQVTRTGTMDNHSFLPGNLTTYYQRLRDDNYRVGCCGKVDLAKPNKWNSTGDRPCLFSYGFTHPMEIEGKMHSGGSPEPRGPYGMYLHELGLYEKYHQDYRHRARHGYIKGVSHDSVLPTDAFQDLYIARRAVEWIEGIGDDFPWHLFVGFAGPHDPFDPPTEYAQRYRDAEMPAAIPNDLAEKPRWLGQLDHGLETDEIVHTRRQYCASIEAIDDGVGKILNAVEERGMLDNTHVIFSADHGEMLGDHGLYTKHVMYESALRVPLVVSGPGIAGGRTSDALVELIDLNPTICELADISAEENIDAKSFASVLSGRADHHRDETVSALDNAQCIRTERWKMIVNPNDRIELYDLDADPQEHRDVSKDNGDVIKELTWRMKYRLSYSAWRR